MSNQQQNLTLKTACTRLARQGLQCVNSGDVASGVAYIKVAEALANGHNLQDTLNAYFQPETHQKVAAELSTVVNRPSQAAVQQLKTAMYQAEVQALREKYASNGWLAAAKEWLANKDNQRALIGGGIGAAAGGLGGAALGGKHRLLAAILGAAGGGLGGGALGYNGNRLLGLVKGKEKPETVPRPDQQAARQPQQLGTTTLGTQALRDHEQMR